MADEEPWKVIKVNPDRVKSIMNTALQIVAGLSVLSEPFLPFTALKLQTMLKFKNKPEWVELSDGQQLLKAGHQIGKPVLLFAKIEDTQIQAQLDKLQATKLANVNESSKVFNLEPLKPNVSFEDFLKMDIRIGVVVAAEKIPKTKKLLVLKVKVGDEVRSIVSAIAMDYDPDSIIGQKVTVLCNLKPRNLRGVQSQGMILMTKSKDGSSVFVQPDATQNTVSGLKVS